MIISIRAKHIEAGERYRPGACPIARALSDALGGQWRVGTTTFRQDGSDRQHVLSDAALQFRRDFDGKRPVRPCFFEADLADSFLTATPMEMGPYRKPEQVLICREAGYDRRAVAV